MKRLALSLFLTGLLAACSSLQKDYPPEVRRNFVNSCAAKVNGDTSICGCLFEKIKLKYSYKEFAEMDKQAAKGIQTPAFVEFVTTASKDCMKQVHPE
jgi:hypothetical protein